MQEPHGTSKIGRQQPRFPVIVPVIHSTMGKVG